MLYYPQIQVQPWKSDLHTPFLWKNHPQLKLSANHLQVCLYLLHGGGDSANNSLAHQKIQSYNTISKFIYQKKRPHCSYFVQVKKNFLCLLMVTTVFIIDTEFLFLQKQKETLFTTCHFDFFKLIKHGINTLQSWIANTAFILESQLFFIYLLFDV